MRTPGAARRQPVGNPQRRKNASRAALALHARGGFGCTISDARRSPNASRPTRWLGCCSLSTAFADEIDFEAIPSNALVTGQFESIGLRVTGAGALSGLVISEGTFGSQNFDTSERSSTCICDDGLDNDGDALTDFPFDPGCAHAKAKKENPWCNDGIDNDGDTFIDFPADTYCTSASAVNEAAPSPVIGCGIGPELVFGVPLLAWARRRRHSAHVSQGARTGTA